MDRFKIINRVDGLKTYIVSALLALHGGYGMTSPGPTWENPYQSDPTSEVLTGMGLASLRQAISKRGKPDDK